MSAGSQQSIYNSAHGYPEMIEVDLHLHTTFSDGRLTPAELVKLCAQRGLKEIAVTDHDSLEGIPDVLNAAREYPGLEVIVGVELSTDVAGERAAPAGKPSAAPGERVPDGEVHLLGYFVDRRDAEFRDTLARFRSGREQRGRGMVKRLNDLGVDISWERVEELSDGGAVGRPHIAQALVEAGYVQYPREAFDKYIGRDGPAYVERTKLTPVDAVRALARNGALPVMAHPTYFMQGTGSEEVDRLKTVLRELKDAGLVGMEVYYGNYSAEEVATLAAVAEELDLVPCGGSDYHAAGNPGEPEPGSVGPPIETATRLRALLRRGSPLGSSAQAGEPQ
jgi:hypothetical protein